MEIQTKPCYKCGSTANLTTARTVNRPSGKKDVYFICRACNTVKLKAYRNTPNGREKVNQAVYRSVKKYPHKQKARMAVNYALKKGILEKNECKCGSYNVEAHHPDYNKPLDVKWLCRTCHGQEHSLITA